MQLAKVHDEVTATGIQAQSTFSIEMNGKMFRLLSDSLYQNKIGSMVRELACNALDSHFSAGKFDEPFDVHLPDAFEPWFSITDNGIGLSHDDVETIYTSYGKSTKDESNDTIGAFGIGGKLPFAYADAFTVIVRHAGMKRIYSMHVNGESMPVCALMSEQETDECNGMSVQVAVKNNDIHRFHVELRDQLRFFKVKPNVTNIAKFAWHPEADSTETLIRTDDIVVYNTSGEDFIIQGQVGYPIDSAQLSAGIDADNYKFFNNIGYSRQIHLHFAIGDIEVTASREGIQYSAHTLKNINDKITACRAIFTQEIRDRIAALPNEWEKVRYINSDDLVRAVAVEDDISFKLAKGYKGYGGGITGFHFSIESLVYDTIYSQCADVNGVMKDHVERHSRSHVALYLDGFRRKKNSWDIQNIQPLQHKQVIFIRDKSPRPVVRMKHFFNEGQYSWGLCLQPTNRVKDIEKYVEELKEALGGFVDIYRVSELPEPPKGTAAARPAYTRPTAYQYTGGDYSSCYNWERLYDKPVDMPDGGIYVPIDRFVVNAGNTVPLKQFDALRDRFTKDLIGLRVDDIAKIKDDPEWISLDDALVDVVAEIKQDIGLCRYVRAKQIANELYTTRHTSSPAWTKVFADNPDIFHKGHVFVRVARATKLAERIVDKYRERASYASLIDVSDIGDGPSDLVSEYKAKIAQYVLVELGSYYAQYYDDNKMQHLVMYIRAVDALDSTES